MRSCCLFSDNCREKKNVRCGNCVDLSWYLYRMELGRVVAACRCDGGRCRPAHMMDKTGKES